MTRSLFLLCTWLCLALMACKHTPPQASADTKPDAPLTNTLWKLVRIEGKVPALKDGEIRLQFPLDTHNIRGYGGCNDYSGLYDLEDTSLRLHDIISTERACENLKIEQQYFRFLGEIETYQIKGDQLTLSSSGEALLIFEALYLR